MPCSGPGGPVYVDENDITISRKELAFLRDARKDRDLVTRLLCTTLRELKRDDPEYYDAVLDDRQDLAEWWEDHQELDRKRRLDKRKARKAKIREIKLRLNQIKRSTREMDSDKIFLQKAMKRLRNIPLDKLDLRDFDFE